MTYNNNNKIECAVIRVDSINDNNERVFNVRIKDIENTMIFIKKVYEEFKIPYSRIYLSGFALLSESFIWTKQKIVSVLTNNTNRNIEVNSTSKTR